MGLLLPALLACRPAASDAEEQPPDEEEPASTCPDLAAPALETGAWTKTGDVPATGMHALASDGGAPVWIASHSTGVWRAEADLAWQSLVLGITHTIAEMALRPGDPDHLFRSAGGDLERTRDGGETWESLDLGRVIPDTVPDEVWAIAVTPWAPDRVLAVQESGAASISEDDGDTFVTMGYPPVHEPAPSDDPFAVAGWRVLPEVEEGGRVIFGDGFGVAVSDDAMGSWTRTLDTPLGGYSLMRDPLDPTHVLVGGDAGLYESFDEGSTWTLRDVGDVVFGAWSNDGSWLALGGETELRVSTDGAETFTSAPHGLHMAASALILDDGRIVVATHHGADVSADRGATWEDVSAGLEDRGMSVVVADPACPARVISGSRCGGGLFTSEDYGATWSPVPAYFHYVMGVQFDPAVAGRIWAVSDDRLLRSDDQGATWTEAWRKYHFHAFALHPDDPDVLLLGSVGSGEWADDTMRVYRSEDGGETWADSSDGLPESEASAHALLRVPGDPDVVLLGTYKAGDVSHRTGTGIGLYRSEDGGATWSLGALDVLDVASLAAAGEAVWAATDDGLWRSGDAGVTWEQADGPAGELLSVVFHGDVGLALERSGAVWETTDGGETWTENDADLPVNPTTTLAQAGISADGAVGYVTVFDEGVYRIGL